MWRTRSRRDAERRSRWRIVSVALAVTGVAALSACDLGEGYPEVYFPVAPYIDGDVLGDFVNGGDGGVCPAGQFLQPPPGDYYGPVACRPNPNRPTYHVIAQLMLLDQSCSDLVGGGNMDPNAVLHAVADRISTPSTPNPDAVATAGPVGSGTNGNITLHPDFFNQSAMTYTPGWMPTVAPLTRAPTFLEMQALVLLHEVGHLTGANNHGRWEPGRVFNAMLLDRCLKLVQH